MSCKRFMIAAPKSGSGKTIFTCAIINILKNRGLKTVSFKCGPDYIDPIFHSSVLGIKSRNLDIFMSDENTVKYLYDKNSKGFDTAVMEGVMGYYDGLGGKTLTASSYDVSRVTKTPVVLIIDAKGSSVTLSAVISGIKNYRKDSNIKAVVLNKVSKSVYIMLKDIIEEETGVKAVGYIPDLKEFEFDSRYLGLSIKNKNEIQEKIDKISEVIKDSVDIDCILNEISSSEKLEYENIEINKIGNVNIAVAYDEAFNFYYEDSFDLLRELGCNINYFSPLKNEPVPQNSCGIIIGGGYPENYGEVLSQNTVTKESIRKAVSKNMPLIAECGGFMYLNKFIDTGKGKYEMCGVLDNESSFYGKLRHFGYINIAAEKDGLFGNGYVQIKGHEFHYYMSTDEGSDCTAQKPVSKRRWQCVHYNKNMYAGFPHIYMYSNIKATENFVRKCIEYKNRCLK